ncbi:GGDEF domain-containing protein [Psychrosphaera algicola]|uniref:Diguanylate cyclase n=1 Tax=Psychrosphaera algicola TaxID=3023714 RepID=A0ABT5FII7_9GAMM|nr:diguanylate cyclase [Psychrosphaera sp. G1-22]MDC2891016.1 diguanylate cyclase [Psychrosphaera sp. G1-22]
MIFSRLETSFRDNLSGLYSEAYFAEVFQREWNRMMREKDALTIMIIHTHLNVNQELDRKMFKVVSEHVENSTKRSTDLVCRFHENEIAIGLFNLDENGTETVAKRILTDCVSELVQLGININFSIGALNVLPNNDIELEQLFNLTEDLTFKAESKGPNACELQYYKLH